MKITSLILLFAASLVLVGCEKREGGETTPPPATDTNAAGTNAPAQ